MRFSLIGICLALMIGSGAWAQDTDPERFSFLDEYDVKPSVWTQEENEGALEERAALDLNLAEFYRDFAADRKVSFFVGYGYEAYFPERAPSLFAMLQSLARFYRLPLDQWQLTADQRFIRFRDRQRGLRFELTLGNERDDFSRALSRYEVVMYTGHSRYGRGPTFSSFWNYFRMGNRFPVIEVDTRNPYFQEEPILLTENFPLKQVFFGNQSYLYQYRGQKTESSYLPATAYTKNIPGGSKDLDQVPFGSGRQILYFQSCRNQSYWRDTLRALLPDPGRKAIFGTKADAWGGTKPDAVMIMSVVRAVAESRDIVQELNATRDCDECFTTY